MAPGHPTNADREESARPVIERFMAAAVAGSVPDAVACLAEDVEWLLPDGRVSGREAAEALMRSVGLPAGTIRWERVQQHGAHAVLGWIAEDGTGQLVRGTTVVEIRRGVIVFRADG